MAFHMKIFFYDYSKDYITGHVLNGSDCEEVIENHLKLYGLLEELRVNRYVFIKIVQCTLDGRNVAPVAQLLYDEMCQREMIPFVKRNNIRYAHLEYR